MPYTIEDYKRDYALEYIESLSPEDRLKGLSIADRMKGLSPDEIERFLKKLMVDAQLLYQNSQLDENHGILSANQMH